MFKFTLFLTLLANSEALLIKIFKKEEYFVFSGIQICNQNYKIPILKIWPLLTFDLWENADFAIREFFNSDIHFQHSIYYGKTRVPNIKYGNGVFSGKANIHVPLALLTVRNERNREWVGRRSPKIRKKKRNVKDDETAEESKAS